MLNKLIVLVVATAACATAPKTAGGRSDLVASANTTLVSMERQDSGLSPMLASSAGYAVFPSIGKGGVVVGGAYGRGVLYQHGRHVGFVELNQASIGLQLGAQTFTELVVFRDQFDIEKLKSGDFSLGGNVSAVVLTTGAAATTPFVDGVAVFVIPRGGAMVEASLSGQKINYVPAG